MKRKVGELFNKPIVQGNENVLSSNEILVEQKGDTISLKERVNGEIKEVSGGNNGGGSASSMEYIDISGANDNVRISLAALAENIKSADDGGVFCGLPRDGINLLFGAIGDNASTVIAVGIDFSRKIKAAAQGQLMELSLIDMLITMLGINKAEIDALPRITEEEFYNLNN